MKCDDGSYGKQSKAKQSKKQTCVIRFIEENTTN
jgi:hypothetical protein